MIAAQIGKLEHVKMLHKRGANVTRNMPQKNRKDGLTALELSIKSGKFPVVEYLLDNVPELAIKKADQGDLRDRAPALYYACRQTDVRILKKVIDTNEKRSTPLWPSKALTDQDKKLALAETLQFENQDGVEFLLATFNQSGLKLTPHEKQGLLGAAAERGNIQLFETLLESDLLAQTDEVDYEALVEISSEKNYVGIMRKILSNQYSIESAEGQIHPSKLDALMRKAVQNHQFDMALLVILYGANPAHMSLDENTAAFADYLSTKPPETFDAFFTEKDIQIIQQRGQALQQMNHDANRLSQQVLAFFYKVISLFLGSNLGIYYDRRRGAVDHIVSNVLTTERKSEGGAMPMGDIYGMGGINHTKPSEKGLFSKTKAGQHDSVVLCNSPRRLVSEG